MTTFHVAVCGECETFCSFHQPRQNRQLASLNAGHHDVKEHQSATTVHETARVESFESDSEYPRRPPLEEFVDVDDAESEEVVEG